MYEETNNRFVSSTVMGRGQKQDFLCNVLQWTENQECFYSITGHFCEFLYAEWGKPHYGNKDQTLASWPHYLVLRWSGLAYPNACLTPNIKRTVYCHWLLRRRQIQPGCVFWLFRLFRLLCLHPEKKANCFDVLSKRIGRAEQWRHVPCGLARRSRRCFTVCRLQECGPSIVSAAFVSRRNCLLAAAAAHDLAAFPGRRPSVTALHAAQRIAPLFQTRARPCFIPAPLSRGDYGIRRPCQRRPPDLSAWSQPDLCQISQPSPKAGPALCPAQSGLRLTSLERAKHNARTHAD